MVSGKAAFFGTEASVIFPRGPLKGSQIGINGQRLFVAFGVHGRCGKEECTCLGSQHIVGALSNGLHIVFEGDCLLAGEGLVI